MKTTDMGKKLGPRLLEPRLMPPLGREHKFTQPKAHLIAHNMWKWIWKYKWPQIDLIFVYFKLPS